MALNRSKLKATELAFVDTNNIEYIVHDFERQGLVARTKDQLKSALSKLGSNNGTICIVDTIDIDEDLTIPENISLKFFNGGRLNADIGSVSNEELGTGDSSTTEFSLTYTPVLEGSETIYVNEQAQVRDTDYTINYETGVVTFTTAPADGAIITANYIRRFTLTLNCGIDAGLFQIFGGDGVVTGNPKIEAVYPEWFGANDIGERINRAISLAPTSSAVFISSNIWNNVDYSTMINVNKRVDLIFPGVRTKANYLGTGCALKLNVTAGCVIKGFAVDLSNNSNTNVDGVVVFRSHDNIFADGLHIESAPRHGLIIDAENGGAYHNVFRGVVRIQGSGGNNIKITSSGTALPNANSFYRIVLSSCSLESIFIEKGVGISFHDVYIQSGSDWAVKNISGYPVYFDHLVIDSDMDYGISATSKIFCDVLVNNASTKFDTGAEDNVLYSNGDTLFGKMSSRKIVLQNAISDYIKSTGTPQIYSTEGEGTTYPFTEWGNLVFESRYGTYPRDFVFVNNGEITAVFHRNNRIDIYKRIRNVNIITFPDGDTTPSVTDSNIFKTNNLSATSITTFDDGVAGQEITVIFGDSNTTIVHGSGIYTKSGADVTPSANTTMKFVYDGSYWYEV